MTEAYLVHILNTEFPPETNLKQSREDSFKYLCKLCGTRDSKNIKVFLNRPVDYEPFKAKDLPRIHTSNGPKHILWWACQCKCVDINCKHMEFGRFICEHFNLKDEAVKYSPYLC